MLYFYFQAKHAKHIKISRKVKSQEKRLRRITKFVASVVMVFAIFWLPIHFINLWIRLDPGFPRTEPMYWFKILAHSLSYANSCVNPFIYAFYSDGFRKAFRETFPSLVYRLRINHIRKYDTTEMGTRETRATTTEERAFNMIHTDL